MDFSVADGRRGPQALSVKIIDAPPSLAANSRTNSDDLAAMIEDTIKILDKVGPFHFTCRHGECSLLISLFV